MNTQIHTAIGHFRHGIEVYLQSPADSRCLQAIPILHQAAEGLLKGTLQKLLETPAEDWQTQLTHYLIGEEAPGNLSSACHELRERSLELRNGDVASAEDETLVRQSLSLLLEHLEAIFKNDLETQLPSELLRAVQTCIYTCEERREIASQRLARWKAENLPDGDPAEYQGTLSCPHCGDRFDYLLFGFHSLPFCFCCNTSMNASSCQSCGQVYLKEKGCCADKPQLELVRSPDDSAAAAYARYHVTNAQFVAFLNQLHRNDELDPSEAVIALSGSDESLINIAKSPIKFENDRFSLVRRSLADQPVTKVSPTGARLYAESLGNEVYRVHGGLIHAASDHSVVGLDWLASYRDDELIIVAKTVMRQVLGDHYELDDRLVLAAGLRAQWQRNLLHQSEEALQYVIDEEENRDVLARETEDWNECAFSFRLDQILSNPTQASLPQPLERPHQDDSKAALSCLAG